MQDIKIIEHLIFATLSQKIFMFWVYFWFFFIIKFWNHIWEWTWPWTFMDKKCTYVWNAHKWRNWMICRHVYFLWCIIVTKPITKCTTTSTHVHVRKNNVVYRFHYPLPCMCETKILEPLLTNGNYPFSQQYFHTQAKKKIQSSKNLKENGDISFFEYLNF